MKNIFLACTLAATSLLAKNNFVLIAAPGTGKGTFSQHLVKTHGYVQICPGDIFRAEIEARTDLGKQIQPMVERGDYVDESIVCRLIGDRLSQALSVGKAFIIDGFPRSIVSLEFLQRLLEEKGVAISTLFVQFIAKDELCIDRIATRPANAHHFYFCGGLPILIEPEL